MAIHANSIPAPADHPSAATPMGAIAVHAQAYEASVAAFDRLLELRRTFDPELVHEDELAVSRAITARYGYRFGEVRRDLSAREAEANATAKAEDVTWLTFRAMVPTTSAEPREWSPTRSSTPAGWTRSSTYGTPCSTWPACWRIG